MSEAHFVWYDVFTDRPFTGNALAVFTDATGISEADMPRIARELNLSETTFVFSPETPGTTHRVRIFTPSRELAFAGHPTVGTAVALADASGANEVDLVLGLGAGPTPVTVRRDARGVMRATFVAPQLPRTGPSPIAPAPLAALIGLDERDLDPQLAPHLIDAGGTKFVAVGVRSLDALAASRAVGSTDDIVGVYVVVRVDDGWQCRMFAPGSGVPEDPATGSAACAFAGTLHQFVPGHADDGTYDVSIRQGVEMGRPSELQLSFDVSHNAVTEVRLTGAAARVLDGTIRYG